MNPETKVNFDPAQPRDPSGRWHSGGGAGRLLTRIGDRLGRQPLPSGHIPHPHGQVWVNPSSARIVQFHREPGGIGSITRTGKNVILARGVPVEQALDHVNNNLPSIIQTAEPELRDAMPQTIVRGAPSALSRKRTLYINPSARNMTSIFKQSKEGRVKTLVIGDNLVVGPNGPGHYDMVRILQRAGHPLGERFYQSSHLTPLGKSRSSTKGRVKMKSLTADTADFAELKQLLSQMPCITTAPCELKFVGDPEEGLIEGYASIYGNVDGHGDVVDPGAFDVSLKDFIANGKQILFFGEHSPYKQGGDPYPVGKWESVESDEKGLRVKGRLLALDHPDVKRVHTLIKAGALPGISIAYKVNPGGAELGRKAGEPKRRLKSVDLVSIDLTANPSNPLALIDGFKAVSAMQSMATDDAGADEGGDAGGADPDECLDHLEEAMQACHDMIDADQPPDVEDLTGLMERLHDCHDALTGNAPHVVQMDVRDAADLPEGDGVKSLTFTKRQLQRRLREEPIAGKRLSQREARDFVDRVFDDEPRDEADEPESKATDATVTELTAALADFTLIPRS